MRFLFLAFGFISISADSILAHKIDSSTMKHENVNAEFNQRAKFHSGCRTDYECGADAQGVPYRCVNGVDYNGYFREGDCWHP